MDRGFKPYSTFKVVRHLNTFVAYFASMYFFFLYFSASHKTLQAIFYISTKVSSLMAVFPKLSNDSTELSRLIPRLSVVQLVAQEVAPIVV